MTKKQPEDTKLLVLPSKLVDELKEVSSRKGQSVASLSTEFLEKALLAEKMGIGLGDALTAHQIIKVQAGSGTFSIDRRSLAYIIEDQYKVNSNELKVLFRESGLWFGKYLANKLPLNELYNLLEKSLSYSWNLDEVHLSPSDDSVNVRFVSFTMSNEITDIFLAYLEGIFFALGLKEYEKDSLRGMATIRYVKDPNAMKI